MKPTLSKLQADLSSVVIFRNITHKGVLENLRAFLSAVCNEKTLSEKTERYCDFVSSLYEQGCDLGSYLEDSLRCDDNAYVRLFAQGRDINLIGLVYVQGI